MENKNRMLLKGIFRKKKKLQKRTYKNQLNKCARNEHTDKVIKKEKKIEDPEVEGEEGGERKGEDKRWEGGTGGNRRQHSGEEEEVRKSGQIEGTLNHKEQQRYL